MECLHKDQTDAVLNYKLLHSCGAQDLYSKLGVISSSASFIASTS